jgi:adenosylcobinamide kinase/adenosylcobinamide-phosphate guanylyltransferase
MSRVSRIVVIGGGVRSGKSSFALGRARALGSRRVFIATAEARDDEMRSRIVRHVDERGGTFGTVEAPLRLVAALTDLRDVDVAVIDCLTLWLSNLLLRGDAEEGIACEVDALLNAAMKAPFAVVVVTNEVGMGVVPESALGRLFRDVTGRAHQRFADCADEIYFGMMGCIVRLRPSPVAIEERRRVGG